jgi:septal ring factor EnvC (AmiA/AmiB activator)
MPSFYDVALDTIDQLRADLAERDATIATLRTDQAALNDDVLADAAHSRLRAQVAERDETIAELEGRIDELLAWLQMQPLES